MEDFMFKRLLRPILAAATVSVMAMPAAYALSGYNGVMLNGVMLNGVMLNGVMLNGVMLNGSGPIEPAFHAVRVTLPNGTQLNLH
jgi:hypothetical protein